jgi:hypothetical protein
MKVIPLKKSTIDFQSKRYNKKTIYTLALFDMVQGIKLAQLMQKVYEATDEQMEDIYIKIVEMGVIAVDGKKTVTLKPEWFVIQELGDKIMSVNTKSRAGLKKLIH